MKETLTTGLECRELRESSYPAKQAIHPLIKALIFYAATVLFAVFVLAYSLSPLE
jgi:hypothetical protein